MQFVSQALTNEGGHTTRVTEDQHILVTHFAFRLNCYVFNCKLHQLVTHCHYHITSYRINLICLLKSIEEFLNYM